MFNTLLSSTYTVDYAEPIIKWLTIGLALGLIITAIVTFFAKKTAFAKFVKIAITIFALYALVAGITMLSFEISKHYDKSYLSEKWVSHDVIKYVFVPLLITLSLVLLCAITLFIVSKKAPQALKITRLTIGAVCGISLIMALVFIGVYYSENIVGDGYYSNHLDNLALYLSAGLLVIIMIISALVLGKKDKSGFDTHCLSLAGVCIALSFALSYVKLWKMPQGGSITLVSMLPIMLFSFVYGAKKGVLIGLIYGLLQAVQDPYIVHPAQFLLDYPIAFALTGFAGAFKEFNLFNTRPQIKFALSAVIGAILRFFAHVLSGVFAFGAYAEGQNFWAYSLAYNSFVFIDVVLVIVVGVILFSSRAFTKEMEKLHLSSK